MVTYTKLLAPFSESEQNIEPGDRGCAPKVFEPKRRRIKTRFKQQRPSWGYAPLYRDQIDV